MRCVFVICKCIIDIHFQLINQIWQSIQSKNTLFQLLCCSCTFLGFGYYLICNVSIYMNISFGLELHCFRCYAIHVLLMILFNVYYFILFFNKDQLEDQSWLKLLSFEHVNICCWCSIKKFNSIQNQINIDLPARPTRRFL